MLLYLTISGILSGLIATSTGPRIILAGVIFGFAFTTWIKRKSFPIKSENGFIIGSTISMVVAWIVCFSLNMSIIDFSGASDPATWIPSAFFAIAGAIGALGLGITANKTIARINDFYFFLLIICGGITGYVFGALFFSAPQTGMVGLFGWQLIVGVILSESVRKSAISQSGFTTP